MITAEEILTWVLWLLANTFMGPLINLILALFILFLVFWLLLKSIGFR